MWLKSPGFKGPNWPSARTSPGGSGFSRSAWNDIGRSSATESNLNWRISNWRGSVGFVSERKLHHRPIGDDLANDQCRLCGMASPLHLIVAERLALAGRRYEYAQTLHFDPSDTFGTGEKTDVSALDCELLYGGQRRGASIIVEVERDSFGDTARDEIRAAKRLELDRTGEPFLQCGDDGALREWPAARQQHNETADDNKNRQIQQS